MCLEAAAETKMPKTRCELCGGAAAVHCAADSAFLCLRCDARVHGANFLASRHRRRRLGGGPACSATSAASSGGSCVSTADSAESTAATAATATGSSGGRKQRAEAVLEGWAKRMGLAPAAARRALGRCVAAGRVPLRVAMAAALWSEVSSSSASTAKRGALLCRLEATAHVPARLVLTVASWMARARAPVEDEHQEGWAECSS